VFSRELRSAPRRCHFARAGSDFRRAIARGKREKAMRSDMFKVIVERPRWGRSTSGSDYPRGRVRNRWAPYLEDAPRMESMGGWYAHKSLSENLNPLARYLRSNIHRPWSKVKSEIGAHLSCKSAVQKHVLDHLADYVHENVTLHGRTVFALSHRGYEPLQSVGGRIRFYVCPRSGLLRLAPLVRRKGRLEEEEDPGRRSLSRTCELRRMGGVWYELELADIPRAADARALCFDVVERVRMDKAPLARLHADPLWRTGRYAAQKRQLGSREIGRHGLPRDP
jgi:hypothetical protein